VPKPEKDAISLAATAHGMGKERVKPDWPPLTLDEVRAVLREFPDCGQANEIVFASPRPFSAACVVATSAGRVFIKRHHRAVRDREGLLEEHSFLAHLRAHGAPVVRVLADASGDTVIEKDEWSYEIHEAFNAADAYEDSLSWTPFRSVAHAYSAGCALGRLHRASESYDAPSRKPRQLVASFTIFASNRADAAMDRYIAARPALERYLSKRTDRDDALELLVPFHEELLPLLSSLNPLWTQNDLHGSNLLWSDLGADARVAAVIDFGLADRTNAVHDLAIAIERNIVEWLFLREEPDNDESVPVHLDHLYEMLAGYESIRPFSEEEAVALAPMTALCHAEFALSEADYFLDVLHSEEKAYLATHDYLVGHARWFRGRMGTMLLDAIDAWAENRHKPPRLDRCKEAGVL